MPLRFLASGLLLSPLLAQVQRDPFRPLGPLESKALLQAAPGYQVDLVAHEPDLEEPVAAVWDGNGVMYIAEMRSYMQDTSGTGTKTAKNGRIKRLEDTNGDGYPDKVTVFINDLNLPRMILPLDDRIAVTETDTTTVHAYRDTDGDGVADEKTLLWKGEDYAADRSVEHQDSGLIWNLDNDIYVSYDYKRYRFTDGTWRKKPANYIWAQWGLDHDERGQIFYSMNTEPAFSIQMPREYWGLIKHHGHDLPADPEPVTFGKPYHLSFLQMAKICPIDDRGLDMKPSHTMTSVGGQMVYRGASLPEADRHSYFVADPTAHAVRRALISDQRGQKRLTKAPDAPEFLISPDLYFRPVTTHMGPDGAIYVVDMARGIIQDAPWLSEKDRQFLSENKIDQVTNRGRLWRVRHTDFPWDGKQPRMLDEKTEELVNHLDHPNGWWRSTAQKLIILRADRDKATPLLVHLLQNGATPLGRLHALWTLEGYGLTPQVLKSALQDPDYRVRAAAVKIHERRGLFSELREILTDPHPEVAKQLILTLGYSKEPDHQKWIGKVIEGHLDHLGVTLASTLALWENETDIIKKIRTGEAFATLPEAHRPRAHTAWKTALAQWDRGLEIGEEISAEDAKRIRLGENLYYKNCVSCHGPDGEPTQIPGVAYPLAPSLRDSERVHGELKDLMPVLVSGLTGPIQNQNYSGAYMPPVHALGIDRDDRLSELISFIRYAWGKKSPPVSKNDVRDLRYQLQSRKTPWTDQELRQRKGS